MLRHSSTQSLENTIPLPATMILVFLTIMIIIVPLLLVTKNSEKQRLINMKKKDDDYTTNQHNESINNVNHISIMVSYI